MRKLRARSITAKASAVSALTVILVFTSDDRRGLPGLLRRRPVAISRPDR